MNPTDFILAFLSIVLALALQEVLQGIGALMRSGRPRDLPIAQYLFALALVTKMIGFWWAMWFWRGISTWAAWSFMLMLTGLTLLYLQAYLVFPTEGDPSQQTYYLDSARRLWVLELLFVLVVIAVGVLVLGQELSVQVIPAPLFAVLTAIAWSSRNRLVHGVLAALLLAIHLTNLFMHPNLAG